MIATPVPADVQVWWWSALAAGLVVAIVLVILLHRLLRVAEGIEQGLAAVWETGKRVARNTSSTWMLTEEADLLRDLRDEAARHRDLLSGRGG